MFSFAKNFIIFCLVLNYSVTASAETFKSGTVVIAPFKQAECVRDMLQHLTQKPVLPAHSPTWLEQMTKLEKGNSNFVSLDANMVRELKGHPIWAKYARPSDGEGLFFKFLMGADGKFLSNAQLMEGNLGESIQAHFVASTLHELFPKARLFLPEEGSRINKTISFLIMDKAEATQHWVDVALAKNPGAHYLDMTLLKPANGRSLGIEKVNLRTQLGIAPDHFVVSAYNYEPNYVEHDGINKLLLSLKNRDPSKTVIIETNRVATNITPQSEWRYLEHYQLAWPGAKVHFLSRVKIDELKVPGPHFILNDVRGKMPFINRASDVQIVGGPQNLFEALNEGTPTVFFTYKGGAPLYNISERKKMADIALKTGGAIEVDSISGLSDALSTDLRNTRPFTPPYLVKVDGKSAFERHLDELQRQLVGVETQHHP